MRRASPIFLSILLFFPAIAMCYPEMIRHGYTSCTACHVSPAGGGLTTAYGRSISKEVLSRWSFEGEEQLAHGAITSERVTSATNGSNERGLNIGGNFRYIQTHLNTNSFSQGRRFPMQRDLEVAAKWDALTFVSSYGAIYNPRGTDEIDLRRMYLLWNVSENISLRAGRFIPIYGLMFSDHYTAIKQGLQFAQLSERDAVESNFTFENWSGSLSYSQAPESKRNLQQEEALAGTFNYNFSDTLRIGANYWFGDYLGKKRDITGVNALLGFTKKLYSLTEIDLQTTKVDDGEKTKSLYYFQRFGFEVTRGLHLLAQIDGSQTDVSNSDSRFYSYGAGVTFYPRPHFELQFLWTRPKFSSQEVADSAFLIVHYYL
jgi:hypothetical protein